MSEGGRNIKKRGQKVVGTGQADHKEHRCCNENVDWRALGGRRPIRENPTAAVVLILVPLWLWRRVSERENVCDESDDYNEIL